MGDIIRGYVTKYILLLFGLCSLLYLAAVAVIWKCNPVNQAEGEIRVKANQLIYELEDAEEAVDLNQATAPDFELPYCLISVDGRVVISTMDEYPVQTSIDYHTLGGLNLYMVPVTVHSSEEDASNDTANDTSSDASSDTSIDAAYEAANEAGLGQTENSEASQAILYIDCSHYHSQRMQQKKIIICIALGIVWVGILVLLLNARHRFIKDILIPIQQIHRSAKDMFAGNLSTQVRYDYDGEIGTLCHDYEKMREEIEDSHNRELQLREKVHVMYASISHDLKTPLATITGYLENILYDVVQEPDRIKEYLQKMLNKSQVLNKLIDDILEHSKAELNHLSVVKQEVSSDAYLGKLLSAYQADVVEQGGNFSYLLPDNCIMMLDPDRIREVFQNIIGNAVKYGQESVEIDVTFEILKQSVPTHKLGSESPELRDLLVSSESPESQKPTQPSILLVHIRDNGPGIDAADLPFIFDVFYRGNKARTLNVPGSGLGLNIAKYIVEQHGGQIECDSVVGIGTTISFSLPIE